MNNVISTNMSWFSYRVSHFRGRFMFIKGCNIDIISHLWMSLISKIFRLQIDVTWSDNIKLNLIYHIMYIPHTWLNYIEYRFVFDIFHWRYSHNRTKDMYNFKSDKHEISNYGRPRLNKGLLSVIDGFFCM